MHWFDHFVSLYAAAGRTEDYERLKRAFYAADAALTGAPHVRELGLEAMVGIHVDLQLAHLGVHEPALARRLTDDFVRATRNAWDRNRPLIARLGARYRLGIVSNSYGNMPALLAEAALAPFAVVLDSALEGVRKPDPALYERAATRLGLPPSAILHVGDSWERDVVPAHATGMHTAWLAAPAALMTPAPRQVWRLRTLGELAMLLP
jgi:HAD superfamily hydrolase (TIGR01509 family)